MVPGDNDWNECYGYDIDSNNDTIRQLWRDYFANSASQFYQFSTDFPPTAGFPGGSKPTIARKEPENPEMYSFIQNYVAVFGLTVPDREYYIADIAPVNLNAEWVEDQLALDTTCEIKSIILVAHASPPEVVYTKVEDYFARCGKELPILTIRGNDHPWTFCLRKSETNTRMELISEAFRSGPLQVSVVRDPDGIEGDFFHVFDVDPVDGGKHDCPLLV